jgi:hypothetical protein
MATDPLAGPGPGQAVAVLGPGIMDGTRVPTLEALSRQWRAAADAGCSRADFSAVRLALGQSSQAGGA